MTGLRATPPGSLSEDAPRCLCDVRCDVRWQSPTPNANGRFWRIYWCGNVERMPRGWKP